MVVMSVFINKNKEVNMKETSEWLMWQDNWLEKKSDES